jgi:hypothetical protein
MYLNSANIKAKRRFMFLEVIKEIDTKYMQYII